MLRQMKGDRGCAEINFHAHKSYKKCELGLNRSAKLSFVQHGASEIFHE